MKHVLVAFGLGLFLCRADAAEAPAHVSPEVLARPYLHEVVRHLYRWYLDEEDVDRVKTSKDFTYWIEPQSQKLDEGDRSQLAKILIPQLGLVVKVKKADYTIEELGVTVKSDAFKITNVAREEMPDRPPEGAQVVTVEFKDMLDELFRTRAQAVFPEGDFLMRLRMAVRKHLLDAGGQPPTETQIVHLSPISPVANELWVYWETGRMLIRFSSDVDLANPVVWDHDDLLVDTYEIDKQVVVSFHEAPGSNRFLTRDQVGRVIYNCMVYGRRVEFEPIPFSPEEKAAASTLESIDR